MALKQTRRTISFNRAIYKAIHRAAEERDMTAAHFVESLVRQAVDYKLPATEHVSREAMLISRRGIRRSIRQRANGAGQRRA